MKETVCMHPRQAELLAQAMNVTGKLAGSQSTEPRTAALIEQADQLLDKLAAGQPVLWKYVDADSGQEFFLPSRRQNVHSPYTGKSMPQRPEKFQIPAITKELKDEAKAAPKAAPGAPGPKAGAPKNKRKHAAEDPVWKASA